MLDAFDVEKLGVQVVDDARRRLQQSIAEQIVTSFASCPIPEVARLDRTLKKWRREFLAYFGTAGASNGGTEAVNGLI